MMSILTSGFAFVKKAPSPSKNFFFEKNASSLVRSSKRYTNFFKKINGSQDILAFDNFTAPKFALHNKIIK